MKQFKYSPLILVFLTGTALAAPNLLRFQGRLTNSEGSPISGQPRVRFAIYNVGDGGAAVWAQPSLMTVNSNDNGLFSTNIDVPAAIFNTSQPLFLEVIVQGIAGEQPMSPRQQLTSVPFAFGAANADRASLADDVADLSITSDKIANGAVMRSKIADNAVGAIQIEDGSVSFLDIAPDAIRSEHIQDESVEFVDLATDAVTSDNIQDGSVRSVDLAIDSVSSTTIRAGAVGKEELELDSVDSDIIKNQSIKTEDIELSAIAPETIASGYALIPSGAILMFDRECPVDGWSRFSLMDGRFPKGANSYSGIAGGTGTIEGLTMSPEGAHSHSAPHDHGVGSIVPIMGIRNIGYDNYFAMKTGAGVGAYGAANNSDWWALTGAVMQNPANWGTNSGNVAVIGPEMAGRTAQASVTTSNEQDHRHDIQSDGNWRPPYLDVIFCRKD